MECLICGEYSALFGTAQILANHLVCYYRCPSCGFVQTEAPYWLEEAYSSALSSLDTGVMQRNLQNTQFTASVINTMFPDSQVFLDYGAGHGTFVRLMRDRGFDFRWSDRYAANLHAQGFEHEQGRRYDLLTAFELLEHLTNPIGELSALLQLSDNLLTTTLLLPVPPPAPTDWWYYAEISGQHISFYTHAALQKAASRLGVHVISNGPFHLWTRVRRSSFAFRLATNPHIAPLTSRLRRRHSLVEADYQQISGHELR